MPLKLKFEIKIEIKCEVLVNVEVQSFEPVRGGDFFNSVLLGKMGAEAAIIILLLTAVSAAEWDYRDISLVDQVTKSFLHIKID